MNASRVAGSCGLTGYSIAIQGGPAIATVAATSDTASTASARFSGETDILYSCESVCSHRMRRAPREFELLRAANGDCSLERPHRHGCSAIPYRGLQLRASAV